MLYLSLAYLLIIPILPMKNTKKLFYAALPLFVIVILRYGIGADFFSYKYIYNIIDGKSLMNAKALLPNIDISFLSLFLILGKMGLTYQVSISLIVSALVLFTLYWIKKNSENYAISVLIYFSSFFLVWHLSAIRQGIVLTIGAWALFSKDSLAKWKQVLIILFLASFHLSALFLLIFIFIDSLKLNKKKLLILLIFSLIFTYVPLQLIAVKFDFLPGVTKFLSYIRDGNGFLDFPGISRLVLFIVVYVHYDHLSESTYYKKLTDTYLFGVVLYFILNFSDVAAGRLFSYPFTTSMILFPAILNLYKGSMKYVAMALVMLYSSLFGFKEINTIKSQTKISTDRKYLPTTTILNPSEYSFNSYFYQFTQQMDHYEQEAETFSLEIPDIMSRIVPADENMRFVSMYSYVNHNYYIMNQKGETVTAPIFKYKPVIYKHYLRMQNESEESQYYDLLNKSYIEDQILIEEITENTQKEPRNSYTHQQVDFDQLDSEIKALIEYPESLGEVHLFDYVATNDEYKVLKLTYYAHHVYIFLDAEGKLVLDNYYLRFSDMDQNGFFTAISMNSVTTFYYDGTKIWMVNN